MKRLLDDWITSYMEYVEDTEPAKVFHKWVGMSVIASALRKKVCAKYGRLKYYPNLYIVLVADPGVARKSKAIDFGVELMNLVPDIVTSADAVTKEALLQDLESCANDVQMPDGSNFRHASLSIVSREFESFLGQKKENTKMLVLLTDLFDCQELPWKYRTKNSGSNTIPSIYLNMQAATTPDSLASCLPSTAIGGGFTSRVLFIWADKKAKKVAKPMDTPEVREMKEKLAKDLYLISTMAGQLEFSTEADNNWQDWYNAYEEMDVNRLCKDPAFNGWYSRKPTYIIKLAITCAASESNELVLQWKHIERAMREIEDTEIQMGIVFKAIGKSVVTSEVELIMQIIRTRKYITEKELMQLVWRDIDSNKFDNVIETAKRTGRVLRGFRGPNNEAGDIWYYDNDWMTQRKIAAAKKMLEASGDVGQ